MFRKFFLMIISFLMLILSVNAVEITDDLILDDDMILNDQVIIPEGENVVIDLKEKTLEASSDGVRKIINRGTLTIKNGTIVNNNDDAYGIIDNYGSINVQNVVFNDAGCGDGSTLKNRGGNIVVSNTTFNITGINAFLVESSVTSIPNFLAISFISPADNLFNSFSVYVGSLSSLPSD